MHECCFASIMRLMQRLRQISSFEILSKKMTFTADGFVKIVPMDIAGFSAQPHYC